METPNASAQPSQLKKDSFRTLRAVQRAHDVTGAARAVLYALAMHADGETGRRIWPSHGTLVRESGFTASTVKTALKTLEDIGYIRRGDQSLAPTRPGRSVIVWDIALDVLDPARHKTAAAEGRYDRFWVTNDIRDDEQLRPDHSSRRASAV